MEPHAPSYYAASANPFAMQPCLEGETEADVVVIGGGFTGLSSALHAAEAGLSVVLLESNRIAWGASGRTGGQMIPGLRWDAVELVERLGREQAARLLRLVNSAGDLVRERIARHAIACDLRAGHFHAAAKPAHLDAMKRELDCLTGLLGYEGARIVEKAQVGQIVATDRYHGGLLDANGGHLHPLNYALGLASAAQAAGVRIFEDSRVLEIDTASPVTARTPRGRVRARFAVLACDAFMGDLLPQQRRMTMGIANYNVATAPLGPDCAAALIPSGAAVADSRFVLNYYRLSADNRLIFGGGEKYSPRPPRDVAGFVRPYLEGVFPQLRGIAIDHAWGGIVGVSYNRLPLMGRIGNAFYAHGWSGHGVVLTTLAGKLIAQALQGESADFSVLSRLPKRAFPGGALLRHPLSVLGMLYYAMRDRL